ncbi:MAG: SPRY domain-containing protein [Planctomycetota bacterium]|jgi:L-asparaginase/Glu-tRNA(Gln) amidotransferase subunit D
MLFKRISRTDAEKIYIVVYNASGSTITQGYGCCFDVGASVDGVRVTKCETTDMQAFAGVADSDIASTAYGLVQVYGYRAAVSIYTSAGDTVSGDNLTVVGDQWGLTPATVLGTSKAFGFVCEAVTNSASSSQFNTKAKAFIRAL